MTLAIDLLVISANYKVLFLYILYIFDAHIRYKPLSVDGDRSCPVFWPRDEFFTPGPSRHFKLQIENIEKIFSVKKNYFVTVEYHC